MPRSRVKELADEEAARAEAEEPDDGEDGDLEPNGDGELSPDELDAIEAETEGEFVPLSAEETGRRLETAIREHATALAAIFGPEFDSWEVCPMCSALGAVSPDSMLKDPDTVRCEKCHGHGVFLTESFVDNNRFRQCPRCQGNGYMDRPIEFAPVVVTEPAPGASPPPASPIPPMPTYDAQAGVWRDPFGNVLGPAAS